jgi:type III restriction enzyme
MSVSNSSTDLTPDDKLYITEKLLHHIEKDLIATEERFFGSEKFEQYKIKDLFEDNILRKYTINHQSQAEFGLSQKNPAETQYFEDLDNLDWYAYDDNFGTSEEKLLVRLIKDLMTELEEKWTDIYLLRNEKAVKIYSFDKGRAFEPDFLMFANDKKSWQRCHGRFSSSRKEASSWTQIISLSKNSKEGWKQEFLRQISERDEARTLG